MKMLVILIGGTILLNACGYQAPAVESVAGVSPCDCTPDIEEIAAKPQRIRSGNWEFQVRIFAIGCVPDVSGISEKSRLLVQKEVTQLVEQNGIAFFQQSTQRAILEKHLPAIQAQAGGRAISRLHIVVVESAESW